MLGWGAPQPSAQRGAGGTRPARRKEGAARGEASRSRPQRQGQRLAPGWGRAGAVAAAAGAAPGIPLPQEPEQQPGQPSPHRLRPGKRQSRLASGAAGRAVWAGSTVQTAAGAPARGRGRAGGRPAPRGREELIEAAGAGGCGARAPPQAGSWAMSSISACSRGQAGLSPAVHSTRGAGAACAWTEAENQSTCVPLPCRREPGQKA